MNKKLRDARFYLDQPGNLPGQPSQEALIATTRKALRLILEHLEEAERERTAQPKPDAA
jgi:hypothetical protein